MRRKPNPKTILIADDDSHIRKIYRAVLERAGFAVTKAADGGEVVKEARARRPDLIILDLILPGQDGLTVLRDLKADPDLKTIPVIVSTNSEAGEHQKAALALGAAAYLTKVNTPLYALIHHIQTHLTNHP
jgi:CheY-like chemotaxis protein